MIRDIFNNLNEKVATLELPDGTSEEVWQSKIAAILAVPVAPISDISARQFRQALYLRGHTEESIETIIASLPAPLKTLTLISWEYSVTFKRNGELIPQLAAALGWTTEVVDEFFIFASTL
jgi:hypothetical protein